MEQARMLRLSTTLVGSALQRHATKPSVRPVFHSRAHSRHIRTLFYLPVVLQPSFWRSLVPSFLIRDASVTSTSATKKSRNPATFFIWMSLLIGSQAIQLITLKRSFDQFTYDTEQKLALLRNVVRRVKAGEDVDVEKELGTGDPESEKEWEDVMKELESEDAAFAERKRTARKREKQAAGELARPAQTQKAG